MITGAHAILSSTSPDADRAFLRDVLGLPWLTFNIFTMPGLVLVTVMHTFPFVYLLASSALQSVDASYEEAAQILGASKLREGISIYYNLSTRGRNSWNGSNTAKLPRETQRHIQNARMGAQQAEFFDAQLQAVKFGRATGQALGSFTHWIFAALLTTFFPQMVAAFHPGYVFLFFCGMMVLQLVWVKWMVPETKLKAGDPLVLDGVFPITWERERALA
jgi:hypothetical protein